MHVVARRAGYGDPAGSAGMFVLAVAAALGDLSPAGRVATFIRQFLNPLFSVKVHPLITTGDGSQLAVIESLVVAGKLKPIIDQILPVDEVAAAHQYSKSGRAKGKIVLQIPRPPVSMDTRLGARLP